MAEKREFSHKQYIYYYHIWLSGLQS